MTFMNKKKRLSKEDPHETNQTLTEAQTRADAGDYAFAIPIWEKYAELGNEIACKEYGKALLLGEGVEADFEKGFGFIQKYVEKTADNAHWLFWIITFSANSSPHKNVSFAIPCAEELAQKGDARGQFFLGGLYYLEKKSFEDFPKAQKLFRLAAEQGHAFSQYLYATMLYHGHGIDQNYNEALKWAKLAYENGHIRAANLVGDIYHKNDELPNNSQEALKWYQISLKDNPASTSCKIGDVYFEGKTIPHDGKEALKWYKKAIKLGCPSAYFSLVIAYDREDSPLKNKRKVIHYAQLGAEAGDRSCENFLGWSYEKGLGVKKNQEEAIRWYSFAAERGNEFSYGNLAHLYHHGINGKPDLEKAAYFAKLGAEKGDHASFCRLGYYYECGLGGLEKNIDKAFEYYEIAAKKGNSEANFNLAYRYEKGEIIGQDFEMSVTYYLEAIRLGGFTALVNLGIMAYEGRGIPLNLPISEKLLFMAAYSGLPKGQASLAWLHCEKGFIKCYEFKDKENINNYFEHKDDIEDLKWVFLSLRRDDNRNPQQESNLSASDRQNTALKLKKIFKKRMSSSDVNEAQLRARKWRPRNPTVNERKAIVNQLKAHIVHEVVT
jgi:TPR repeat protein